MKTKCPFCNMEYNVDNRLENENIKCLRCGEEFSAVREEEPIEKPMPPIPEKKYTQKLVSEKKPIEKAVCPFCKMEIIPGARKCGHCGEWVTKKPKDKTVYVLLALFLGGLGAHNFYAEQYASAIIKIILTGIGLACLLSGGGVLFIFVSLWCIIDMIVYDPDTPKYTTIQKKLYPEEIKTSRLYGTISTIIVILFVVVLGILILSIAFQK